MWIRLKVVAILILAGFSAQRTVALEVNYSPFFTGEREEAHQFKSFQIAGPLIFGETGPASPPYEMRRETVSGFRPFFVGFEEPYHDRGSFHFLYPLFNARVRPYGVSWDLFTLLRFESFAPEEAEPTGSMRLFPILFYRYDPDPGQSSFGVFPIAGMARNFFFWDEASWMLFPLSARLERGDVVTCAMPWPFIRIVSGPDISGFHLWPLYGKVEREGKSRHRYWIWPLGYHMERDLWKEEPFEAAGFLPFYAWSSSESAVSHTFIWPFFGFTHSWDPEYHERRYFWPLLVQRRGESYRNRWAPFYSRSIRPRTDTRWIMWPLHRHSVWRDGELLNERTQLLYFIYWKHTQSSIEHPELASAVKQHLWPLYSYWNNGSGRTQFQAFSPFEVFFPFNDVVRAKYSPLFAFYRLDIEDGVRSRQSFLFDFVTVRREIKEEEFYLHIGPLASFASGPEGWQATILKGLISYSREGNERSFGAFWINRPGQFATSANATNEAAVRRLTRGTRSRLRRPGNTPGAATKS